jgi:hypothetical protein
MDVYKRGWYIINNKLSENDKPLKQLDMYSRSLIEIYKNKGMIYDM